MHGFCQILGIGADTSGLLAAVSRKNCIDLTLPD